MKRFEARILFPTIFLGLLIGYPLPGSSAEERCEEWVAKVVSVQGSVHARRVGETQWITVKLSDSFCAGDMIRVQEQSRAAVLLPNETLLRLDQNTTISFNGMDKARTSLLDLLKGAVYFFSRIPRALKLATPFVNGAVEGTEFFVRVEPDHAIISVFEGRVLADNALGSHLLESGQSAVAEAGKAPVPRVMVRPRDAVQWALYYPPIIAYRVADFPGGAETDWQSVIRRSISRYWEGDLVGAFSALARAPVDVSDPRFFTYRAGLFLSVGRVDEASADIERALSLDASNSHAYALQSIIALAQNEKEKSLELAEKAVALDAASAVARVALSYAKQGHFDLEGALSSLQEAANLDPENPLVYARLGEIWLSLGYLDRALEAAQRAVALNPSMGQTQTILGFAYLTQIKTGESKSAFEKAIQLDQAAPLPRLGLGLAKIRDGDLEAGREKIQIAAALDPNNSLIRSYLGKAYFEEKRTKLDGEQYRIAKELDPMDPTPWFYDAIRKQTINRPVEALHDLQKSIELNDNRAVYRSRLLLDEDLAARSASLARIYRDLGFEQLALVEGWKAINTDPGNYSSHRFLADSYSALPRHEIARVSELLQSQLLQPINITPVQPRLAESDLLLLEGAGAADPAFNEFNPLFVRNRLALQASGVMGENDTRGGEVVQSGLWGRASYSVGGLRYETDGFRENNDLDHELYNLFAQVSLTHKTSIQAEYRQKDVEQGDLFLLFDPDNFFRFQREKEDTKSFRIGLRHAFGPRSDLIASYIDLETDLKIDFSPEDKSTVEEDGYTAEVQHIIRSEKVNFVSGIGYFSSDRKDVMIFPPDPETFIKSDVDHTNLYSYCLINYPKNITWTLAASADFFVDTFFDLDRDQFNPKVGLTWTPFSGTTVRAAAFKTLKRTLFLNQTLEPTQVAGFNQFFEDGDGASTWRYGFGIDQKFTARLYAGAEFSKRDLEEPGISPPSSETKQFDSEEYLYRVYLYSTPHPWLALGLEYQFERFENPLEFSKDAQITKLDTHRLSFGINFFHPSGLIARLAPTYVDQDGEFVVEPAGPPPPFFDSVHGDDQFWVVDSAIGYRFPKRMGLVTIEAKNLFNEAFKFQDTDPSSPEIYPERLILAKFTVAF